MGSIVDIGRGLQRFGLRVGQHPEFGPVGRHAPNSYHKYGEAIDVTDWRADDGPEYEGGPALNWRERTRRLKERARQLGGFNEVLGPGDPKHDTHLHLALRGKRQDWSDAHLEYLATGRWRQSDGSFSFAPPAAGVNAALLASSSRPAETVVLEEPALPDWRPAASAADRSTDPSSSDYWAREDMKQWAQAHPQLAQAAMARHGASPAAAPPAPAAAPAPATQAAAPQATAPPQRGALNGVQVGGAPPAGARPLGAAQQQRQQSSEQVVRQGWSDWSQRNRQGALAVGTTEAWSQWRQEAQQSRPSLIEYL